LASHILDVNLGFTTQNGVHFECLQRSFLSQHSVSEHSLDAHIFSLMFPATCLTKVFSHVLLPHKAFMSQHRSWSPRSHCFPLQ